eukprot:TRINITY_DN35170_c0_g1_i1.p2 TRINITY_DN35170_c0_g1~~TRINITY_DN35170_c0_g1_i1.p2  ORF type:complete len:138 (-),score=29.52 TRINITY_DN35170_c0_g1_i1:31-444(-)
MNHGQCSIEMAMVISRRLVNLRLEDATASAEKDKVMIDDLICRESGGFKEINMFLVKEVRKAMLSTEECFQQDLSELQSHLSAFCSDDAETLDNPGPITSQIVPHGCGMDSALEAGELPRLLGRRSAMIERQDTFCI